MDDSRGWQRLAAVSEPGLRTEAGLAPPFVSVCIVSGRRAALLERCLDSLLDQEGAPEFELLVGADRDPTVADIVSARFPEVGARVVQGRTRGELRNALIHAARGEWLLFLDDDIELDRHFLSRLSGLAFAHTEVEVFGGPNLTPLDSSRFQVVQGAVLASIGATGPVRRRYGKHPPAPADERWFTLCTLAIRRRVMPSFDGRLVCAEENAVLEELRRHQVAMRYQPELSSYHERRATWRSFADQMHIYGRGRGQLLFFRPRTARPALLAPSALVVYLAAAVPLALLSPFALVPLIAYLVVISAVAGRVGWSLRKPAAVPLAAGLTATVHLWYGVGVLRGWAAEGYASLRRVGVSLWNYVDLLGVLTGRQLRVRSKRSLVGVVWPIVGPAFLLVLYMFVFNHIFRQPIPRYPVYLVAGLLPWTFLAQTLGTAVVSLSSESELILQARFAYELLPLGAVTAMSTYFLVSLTGFLVYLGVSGQLVVALLPAIIVPLASIYLFVAALAIVLAFIDIYNRDLRQVLANLLTVWFFLVPIVYSQARLGSGLKLLQSFDPINMIVGEFRDVLYYGHLSRPAHIGELLSVCIGTFFLVVIMFRRASRRIPKEI